MRAIRGLFERIPGTGVWWIRYADATGKIRREKVGNKGAAIKLYRKRKTEVLEGKKLPENLRHRNTVPTLNEFSKRFNNVVEVRHAAKPKTVQFYDEQVKRLLEYGPLANARLNEVDEALIEEWIQYRSSGFVRHRTKDGIKKGHRQISAATVNRGLATLRRMMRLARTWRVIDRVPEICLLSGERNRQFVLDHASENVYLEFSPQPLRDVALLLIDTGLRLDEGLSLEWSDVHLTPNGSRLGFVQIRCGKSKNARRAVPLTERTHNLLERLRKESKAVLVFANGDGQKYMNTTLEHMHSKVRTKLKLSKEFVLHGLRHTYLTRLGLAGADSFTIMRLAGHSSVSVSQKYVHPTPEAMENAVARLDRMNTRSLQSKSECPGQSSSLDATPQLSVGELTLQVAPATNHPS